MWTENIIAKFRQKIPSGCLKIGKIYDRALLFCRTLYQAWIQDSVVQNQDQDQNQGQIKHDTAIVWHQYDIPIW